MERHSKFEKHAQASHSSSRSTSPIEQINGPERDGVTAVQADAKQAVSIHSITSSVWEPPPIVPRHLRRGVLARFCLIAETTLPTRYPRRTKWIITFIVAVAAAAAPTGSATIMPALPLVSKDFHADDTITNLSMALYMLSMSIFPLWWSSFSETLGRRTIYVVSFTMYTIFAVLASLSTNISMLIVTRILAGGSAASVQAVGAGTIADIWEPRERGKAMGIFYLGPMCGPLLAPIIGGALSSKWGWRSTQWFLVIFGGIVTVGLIVLLPETLKRKKPALEDVEPQERRLMTSRIVATGAVDTYDLEKKHESTFINSATNHNKTEHDEEKQESRNIPKASVH